MGSYHTLVLFIYIMTNNSGVLNLWQTIGNNIVAEYKHLPWLQPPQMFLGLRDLSLI